MRSTVVATLAAITLILPGSAARAQLAWTPLHPTFLQSDPQSSSLVAAVDNGTAVGSGFGAGFSLGALQWAPSGSAAYLATPPITNPFGASFSSTVALDITGTDVVGYGALAITPQRNHALLWSNGSGQDIHPDTLAESSVATGTSGGVHVGWGVLALGNTAVGALRWDGTTAQLLPALAGTDGAKALGIAGNVIVGKSGDSLDSDFGDNHAVRWDGTTLTDLHQATLAGFFLSGSQALATDGTSIVGSIEYDGAQQQTSTPLSAALWRNGALTGLHSEALLSGGLSLATAVSGPLIVGYGSSAQTNNQSHALVWQDDHVYDLHLLMALDAIYSSYADAVDSDGTVYGHYSDGFVSRPFKVRFQANPSQGYLVSDPTAQPQRVPEPATLSLLTLGSLALLRRRNGTT